MRGAGAAGLAILTGLVGGLTASRSDETPAQAPTPAPARQAASTRHATRAQLLGAWRLVRIDYRGPEGPAPDPFYQPDSDGLLIYDASGWMSVEIGARQRESVPVPESRIHPPESKQAQVRAAAFDTYYAYFGTWSYDRDGSLMTHRVQSSLIASENGLEYRQEIILEGGRLTFVNRLGDGGGGGPGLTRRKVWERISREALPP